VSWQAEMTSAEEFCEAMLQQPMVRKHLPRELLALCWTRGLTASMEAPEASRPTLAIWYASGMVQGLLWSVQALHENQELAILQRMWEQWVTPHLPWETGK
jgi:hypothetical protein